MIPLRRMLAALSLTLLVACARPEDFQFEDYDLVDLTYSFDESTLYWPTGKPFEHEQVAWGMTEGGYWYSSYNLGGSEHGGTHLDAPIHFAEGKPAVADIPIEQLAGPAVVVDISQACERDADYLLSRDDVETHEKQHGRIEPGSVVLIRTGWGRHWPDAKQYLGSDTPGDTENLHFPGVSPEAAEELAKRSIALVGIDTASIDRGASKDFRAHRVFAEAQIPCLENVAQLGQVPVTGAYVIALPMKIGRGSGAPCRIVAFVPGS